MAGVMCPRCGTVSPTETRACPKCGASLGGGAERTGRSRSFDPLQSQSGKRPITSAGAPRPRPRDEAAATSPDDTLADEERRRPPKVTPGAGVPRASQPPVRKPNVARAGTGSPHESLTGTSGKDVLIGRKLQEYVLESRLGVGGMGVVYKAVHPMIGKHVAIKVLRPDVVQDPRDMDRLLEEARVVSSIKNRGIINIFGAGTLEDGRHYLIMELLEGESVEQYMLREGKVPPGDAVIILEQTLSALAAAHEAGIVHRDLKPANIFLVQEANQMYVKLLDFGLARRKSENVTRIAGTPDYISPEHARGRPAGPPADLYAFGVLCFHMLTGQLPFIGNTPMEVMEKHVHSPPPVPHEVNKEIPKALSELILKLLEKEPGNRPDANQVKADLRAATRQMRNAATMMSLMVIEPVVAGKPVTLNDDKRAKELARDAQLKDLKRKATRKWPYVVGAVVAVWLAGVAAYVLWPAKPPPVITKRPVKDPLKDPVSVAAQDPVPDEPKTAPKPPVEPVEQHPTKSPTIAPLEDEPDAAVAEAEVDAGPPEEDLNAPIDDVRLGELRRARGIDDKLEEVERSMKLVPKLSALLKELATQTRKTCTVAQSMRDFYNCEDQVNDLYETYRKNL